MSNKATFLRLVLVLVVYVASAESRILYGRPPVDRLNQTAARSFTIDYANRTFLKDGKPFRYISGSIHYFRIPRYYWRDRLMKMYAAGLNTVQMYIPWNYHETEPGYFERINDVPDFLKLCQEVGLYVILRPGPYICAEWEFGGLPPWLLTYDPQMKLRTKDPGFMMHVYRFTERMYEYLYPWMYEYGGPVLMVQIENEYGSWQACDQQYLKLLMIQTRERMGRSSLLFTTDGDSANLLKCGAVKDEIFATVDFGPTSDIDSAFKVQQQFNRGPLVNSEFYTGWLDRWGERHQVTDPVKTAEVLDTMLAAGANVNMYMFHGGTNFGYWNGAGGWPYIASLTSYDYDAPLSEAGDVTEKYVRIRNVIGKYTKLPDVPVPSNTRKFAYGLVHLELISSVSDYLPVLAPNGPTVSKYPLTMEQIRHYYGFILYRHVMTSDVNNVTLNVPGIRDRGYVMVNQVAQGLVTVNGRRNVTVSGRRGESLDILVENQGRINFAGAMIGQTKGIISNVTLGKTVLTDWEIYPLDLDHVTAALNQSQPLKFKPDLATSVDGPFTPSMYTGSLVLPESNTTIHPQDTFIDTRGWGKGQLYINEYNLGRYWPTKGPQLTLFVPACYLRPYPYENTVMLLELEKGSATSMKFVDTPVLNGPVSNPRSVPRYRH